MGGENPLEGAAGSAPPRNMKKKKIKKAKASSLTRISFLPSVFTLLNLFLGYQALIRIVAARPDFKVAIYFITASVVMDGFDGTIARLTKTESNFGVQLDSLVDAVTFGLVTSMLVFKWGFVQGYAQAGSIVAFVFLSAGLIRLARFNVFKEAQAVPANIFVGLPIPIAALAVCSVVLLLGGAPLPPGRVGPLLFSLWVLLVSLLMISNIRYRTVKMFALKNSLRMLFLLALVIACLVIFPDTTIPLLTSVYVLSPLLFLAFGRRARAAAPAAERRAEPAPEGRGRA